MMEINAISQLRCPSCAATYLETMPLDACTIRFPCACGLTIRPKPGDCCVFCSYGSVPCPPIQIARQSGQNGCCG